MLVTSLLCLHYSTLFDFVKRFGKNIFPFLQLFFRKNFSTVQIMKELHIFPLKRLGVVVLEIAVDAGEVGGGDDGERLLAEHAVFRHDDGR